jgi:hypothetical protein
MNGGRGIKENDREVEFKYDIFDIILEFLSMSQHTPKIIIKK